MLQPSRINPKLSAHNQIWGNFDYLEISLAPPGFKVIINKSLEYRENYATHGKIKYFVNRAKHHDPTYEA